MKLKSPKNKGQRFEYYIRDFLRGYGFEARRTPMSGAIEGWKGDITAPNFPFFIECKNQKRTNFAHWWRKANDESGTMPPVVFWNYQGQAFAFLDAGDFLGIIVNKPVIKEKFTKPKKPQKEDKTIGLAFPKSAQIRRSSDK